MHQDRDKVVVYFNGDTLDEDSATNADFYRLTITGQDAETDAAAAPIAPDTVEYDPVANTVTLTFTDDLADYGAGAFHLRIGQRVSGNRNGRTRRHHGRRYVFSPPTDPWACWARPQRPPA